MRSVLLAGLRSGFLSGSLFLAMSGYLLGLLELPGSRCRGQGRQSGKNSPDQSSLLPCELTGERGNAEVSPEDRLPIRSGNLRILSPRAIVRILELLQFTAAFLAVTHDSVPMILEPTGCPAGCRGKPLPHRSHFAALMTSLDAVSRPSWLLMASTRSSKVTAAELININNVAFIEDLREP